MTVFPVLTAIVIIFRILNVACEDTDIKLVDERCMKCFCQAMSKCNITAGCRTKFFACGPYAITEVYWKDAESPGGTDFVACTKNKLCAEHTIQRYMKAHPVDCNRNGIIDCADYFQIHIYGPAGCLASNTYKMGEWIRFLECYLNTASSTEEALRSIRRT